MEINKIEFKNMYYKLIENNGTYLLILYLKVDQEYIRFKACKLKSLDYLYLMSQK